MIGLLKLGAALPRLRHCGSSLLTGARWTKQMPGTIRSNMTRTSDTMESRLRARDMIPEGFRIVYRGNMDNYIHLAHQSSAILTFLMVSVIYRVIFIDDDPIEYPLQTVCAPIGIRNQTQLTVMYAAFFFMMYTMRLISSRYVLRMYYNPTTQTYRAVKIGILPMATRCYDFPAGILTKPTKRSIIPWKNGVYEVNGVKLMFFESSFRTGADFNRMFKE